VFYNGERAAVVKHSDNLRVEGKFEGRAKEASVKRGERMSVVKHKDNLKMEGTFSGMERKTMVGGKIVKGERSTLSLSQA
jgi:hypothetical protein